MQNLVFGFNLMSCGCKALRYLGVFNPCLALFGLSHADVRVINPYLTGVICLSRADLVSDQWHADVNSSRLDVFSAHALQALVCYTYTDLVSITCLAGVYLPLAGVYFPLFPTMSCKRLFLTN